MLYKKKKENEREKTKVRTKLKGSLSKYLCVTLRWDKKKERRLHLVEH